MPLHHTLACDPPTLRRFRRCAPLLLVVSLTAGALAPGLIAGDRPFHTSPCSELAPVPAACAPIQVAVSTPAQDGAERVTEPARKIP